MTPEPPSSPAGAGAAGLALTPDQQAAAAAFASWLATPADGTPFVLQGYAGTGKTFLCMNLLAQVEATGLCWTVVAPTHKAVGVLRHHLALAGLQPTWYPSTIHRLLRLKLKRERDLERCEETEQTGLALEHLGLVLGSNRELVVRDVKPERCDLAEFGLGAADLEGRVAPVIETLTATVEAGESQLALRLLPPVGSGSRTALDGVMQGLRQRARVAEKQEGRALWRRYFLLRDAFAWLGPAAVLTVHRSQGSTFGEVFVDGDVFWPKDPVLRRQLVYVAVSRASRSVSLVARAGSPADQRLWQEGLAEGTASSGRIQP